MGFMLSLVVALVCDLTVSKVVHLLVFDKVSDVIITNPHVQLSVFRTVVCTPKLQKCQFLNNGALGLSLPGSEEMLCQTINAEFIQKALGRAAHVIFCYQLQHVTIRSVPCDVPFYGNTTSFFSSYCAVVCCMELHARSNVGLFFFFPPPVHTCWS